MIVYSEESKMSKKYLIINNVTKVNQPLGTFLVGVIKAKDLLKITHQNPRRYNPELESYAGIQREIKEDKIALLKKYIKTSDATFPNTIIGTLNPDKFEFDEKNKTLKIEENESSFAVIDGQHRLASFENEVGLNDNFDLIVSFFLGLDLEEQAYLFSIINMTQKKLNPSLVLDLTELFTVMTPERLAHNLAKIFNNEKNSPWFKKIKMLGINDNDFKGIISQYTFTKAISRLIADQNNYIGIRELLKNNKKRKDAFKNIKYDSSKHIFWNFYINEEDSKIYVILRYYFEAIKEIFPREWGNKDYILNKTTGYTAFMNFLVDLYNSAHNNGEEVSKDFFIGHLKIVKNKLETLNSDNYPPGEKGITKLSKQLCKSI